MNDTLKTATAAVGLLAGLVTGLYLLGGLVIGLRLLFDHFEFNTVASTLGQLPRAPVVATALIDVIAPAAVIGFVLALFFGLLGRPRPRADGGIDLKEGGPHWWFFAGLVLLSVLLAVPGAWVAHEHEGPVPLLRLLIGPLFVFPIMVACWFQKRRIAATSWSRIVKALAAGGLAATVLLVPVLLVSSALPFDQVQGCIPGAKLPFKGRLIGESGDRYLIEEQFGKEAGVIALPTANLTLSETGDLSSRFACPLPADAKEAARVAEVDLGGHGSRTEQEIATRLRPRLRFDSEEPWRLISVPAFLGERFADGRHHLLCDRGASGACESLESPDQLARAPGEPGYIDIHGSGSNGAGYEAADPACREKLPRVTVVDCNSGPSAAMYYRRTTHAGHWYWDYWWFFRYNDYVGFGDTCESVFCGDHEGDWEGITVVTTASKRPEVIAALYAAHGERVLIEGDVLPRAGNHPLVFVARGTHASYPYWCPGNCREYTRKGGERLPETHHDGAVPWGANSDAECKRYTCVRPLPEIGTPGAQALPLAGGWAGWPGNWGSSCYHGCKHVILGEPSPRSPGTQPRFLCPWAATRVALPNADRSGLSRSERAGDAERLFALCAAQHGGL
jgi:hypothetical protein